MQMKSQFPLFASSLSSIRSTTSYGHCEKKRDVQCPRFPMNGKSSNSCLVRSPFDAPGGETRSISAATDTARSTARFIYQKYGIRGFYVGSTVRLFQCVLNACVTVPLIEYLERMNSFNCRNLSNLNSKS